MGEEAPGLDVEAHQRGVVGGRAVHADVGQPPVATLDHGGVGGVRRHRLRLLENGSQLLVVVPVDVPALEGVHEIVPALDDPELLHDVHVGGKPDHLLPHVSVEAGDDRDDTHEGPDADDDAQEGEEAAESVGAQRPHRLAAQLGQAHEEGSSSGSSSSVTASPGFRLLRARKGPAMRVSPPSSPSRISTSSSPSRPVFTAWNSALPSFKR